MKNLLGILLLSIGLSGCSTTYSGLFRYEAGSGFSAENAVIESLSKIANEFGLKESVSEELKRNGAYGFSRGTLDAVSDKYNGVDGAKDSVLINFYPAKKVVIIISLNASKETEFLALLKGEVRELLEVMPGIERVFFEEIGYDHSILGP